jgi:hypothetical protein
MVNVLRWVVCVRTHFENIQKGNTKRICNDRRSQPDSRNLGECSLVCGSFFLKKVDVLWMVVFIP